MSYSSPFSDLFLLDENERIARKLERVECRCEDKSGRCASVVLSSDSRMRTSYGCLIFPKNWKAENFLEKWKARESSCELFFCSVTWKFLFGNMMQCSLLKLLHSFCWTALLVGGYPCVLRRYYSKCRHRVNVVLNYLKISKFIFEIIFIIMNHQNLSH